MKIFLIILVIYLISLLIIYISNYIKWITDKDSRGTTINDFHSWMIEDYNQDVDYVIAFFLYCPGFNTIVAVFELLVLFGRLFKSTIGKINIR